jgi:hypothetical protein
MPMSSRRGFVNTLMAHRRFVAGAASVALFGFSLVGCVSTSGESSARVTDNFKVYAPFDNERAWGPGFLVGPPQEDLGDGPHVEDSRALRQGTAADPSAPPLEPSPPQDLTPPP